MEKMKTVTIVTCLLVILAAAVIGCGSAQENKNIVIGALVPLTGDWASQGAEIKAALEVSADDVNKNLKYIGSEKQVTLIVEDTELDPATALAKMQNLSQKGVRLVIAGGSSAELKALKDYADKNGMVVIGTSSTAPSLSISGDNLLRFVPDDTHQGEAMAEELIKENISAIIPLTRGDAWGDDLLNATAKNFEARGGKVLKGIRYNPGTNFSSEIKTLSATAKDAESRYGSDKVGIYLVSLDEASTSLALASRDSNLSSVSWYGSDGTANLKELAENKTLAQFAVKTDFLNPIYEGSYAGAKDQFSYISDPVEMALEKKLGFKPFTYALAAYDALKVSAISMDLSGENATAEQLRGAVIYVANSSVGTTGLLALNNAGDRSKASYKFLVIKEQNGSYSWQER